MLLVVALSNGSPEEAAEAMECLRQLQLFKHLAYPVDDPLSKKVKYRKAKIDFVAISGKETDANK